MNRTHLKRSWLLACALVMFTSLVPIQVTHGKQTEPGQQTVWDDIMASQAMREMQIGAAHLEERRYDKAVEQFAKAVIKQPHEPAPHLMLGMAYYWTGQVDQAEAEFREALRLDPKSDQGHLLMGIVQAWRGDARAAYESFSTAESLNHNRADIQMDLGSIEESLGMISQALDHLRRAVVLESDNPLYHFQLGTLYSRLGRDSDAIDSLNLAIKHYSNFEDAMLELGAALERMDRRKEAMGMFHKAVRLKSRDSVARLRLARAYLLLGDANKARGILRDAFHLTPEESGGLALSVSFGGKPKSDAGGSEASKDSPIASSAQQSQHPLDVLARNLQRIPLNQEAKLSIEMAFLPKPKLERIGPRESGSSLKRALAEAGKPAMRTNPVGLKREFVLPASNAAERQAAIDKLLADLRGAMRHAPADAEMRMSMNLSFVNKSMSGPSSTGISQDAKVSYQPRQVGNDLGLWVQGTGWMALVEEVLPGLGENPDHPDALEWWIIDGLGYAALGRGDLALAAFDRALQINPQDEIAQMGRCVALVEIGRDDEAIAAYRRILEMNPKNHVAKEGLNWLLRAPVSAKSARP